MQSSRRYFLELIAEAIEVAPLAVAPEPAAVAAPVGDDEVPF